MQANPKSLSLLMLSANRFVIPEFQRPYCWTKEEVEQLWNDLFGAYEDSKNAPQRSDNPDDYFLGPIVVAKRKERTGEIAMVVDGQQRLTTLHALLWCAKWQLSKAAGEADEMLAALDRLLLTPAKMASLAVANDDQANFLALREGTPVDETRALGLTGSFLRKQIEDIQKEGELLGFLNFILNQTMFILVETESYSSAWDLFIGLNGKGRPLNAADLIKAFVCGTSPDSAAMAQVWNDKVLPLDGDATSGLLEVTRVATGEVGSEAKLFKLFEAAWESKQIKPSLLSDGSMVYQRFWRESPDHIAGLGSGKRFLRGLRTLGRRDHSSLLLALAARFGTEFVFKTNLLRALEAYQLWMAIRGKRGRERDFTALASRVYSSPIGECETMAKVSDLLNKLAPPVEEVRSFVQAAAYPGRIMKFIVNQYEEGMRGEIQVEEVQFEHMMPRTPTAYWYEKAGTRDDNVYARIVNNIGNIAPLDFATNITIQNDDWPTKAAFYKQNVPNWLVAGIAIKSPDAWIPAQIQERAKIVAEWAVSTRWNLTEALQRL